VTSAGVDVNRYDTSVDWGGSRSYHVEVLLSGSGSSVKLGFGNNLNGGFGDETLGIDNVLVTHRLTDSGAITFADPDTADVHSASFAANGAGYFGTFALGSVDQAGNSVGWTFAVDDSDIGWLPGGQTVVQTYAVTVNDGKGGTDVENVAVTITGRNDAPAIGGTSTGSVQEDGTLTASGLLTIADPDQGQSSFQAGTYQGLYGSAVLAANGSWTYTLANAASNVQALNAGQTVTDSVAVKSADGTTYALSLTVAGAEDLAAVGTVVSRAIANGNHFHGSNGYVEVGPWGGGAETVRGAIEFDVTAGSFSTATFKFDVASVGGFSGTFDVYAYRADGVINVSDFNASGLIFVGSVHTSSLFAGAEPSFNATSALTDVFGAGTELGFLITYSGNTGSSYYFNNFELVIG
jgi:VCBS repeat-containing protein